MPSHQTADPPLADPPANVELVRAIKEERIPLRIPIVDDSGTEIGSERPLTKSALDDDDLISTFVRWRNRYLEGWLDQRPVTEEGTRNWLREVVTDPTRMTFLIYLGEKPVARGGFLRLTAVDNESDGLIRGEHGGGMRFMFHAQLGGMIWQFEALGIQSIYSRVLSTNEMALESCRSFGYDMKPFAARRVFRHEYPTGAVLREIGEPDQELPDVRLLYFRLWKSDFYRAIGRLNPE